MKYDKLKSDEIYAKKFFEERDLDVLLFEKKEIRKSKKPDFKIISKRGYPFYCEIKSIHTVTDPIHGLLFNTIYNGIVSRTGDAFKQFESINAMHLLPNVLLFKSHNCFNPFWNF